MLSEQDIELLEMYLDGALDEAQEREIQQRLANEESLRAELSRLEQDIAIRLAAWQSFEAGPARSGEQFMDKIHARERRYAWYNGLMKQWNRIAVTAACIAVFLMGWQWGQNANTLRMVPGMRQTQSVRFITQEQVPLPNGGPAMYVVRISDASGKVIRVERFASLQEAQRFIREIQLQLQTP